MTVIAANKNVLVTDSLMCESGMAIGSVPKAIIIDGDIFSGAGNYEDFLLAADWYRDQSKDRPDIDSLGVLVLTQKGEILIGDEKLRLWPHAGKFYAIGSGSHFVMGCMASGKTPEEAVKLTCKYMVSCGPPVKLYKRQ